jgi:alpha-galactosidase
MAKITFIGAGSTVFAKNLLGDILAYPELADSTIALYDINAERLGTTKIVAERLAAGRGARPNIETHLDRRTALRGANHVISMFQVGGYRPSTVIDFEIPKKYGLRQTIGDTLGIGGIMRGLRTIPVFLDLADDMEEVCPDAWLLNYVNPMAINTMAIQKATGVKNVGLCHSVQGTVEHLSEDIGVPPEEIRYVCAGINHMAFYLNLWRRTADGGVEDLYPYIQRVIDEGRVPEDNKVRYEMFKRLGHFVTESSEHFAEYVPWFIKRDRPDLLEKFNIPLDEYIARCEFQIAGWEFARRKMEHPDEVTEEELQQFIQYLRSQKLASHKMIEHAIEQVLEFDKPKQSLEYGSGIIHSIETDTPRVVYGNVLNYGLIDNLPQGCAVEVPCVVDANGVQPTRIGALPTHLAALMRTQINVQELTVEAALTGRREAIYHAAMLDPHTAAELDLDQIWHLVDDLLEAHGDWLPEYK